MAKRRVLLTGAAGTIAGLLLPAFRERFDLVLLDVRNTDREGNEIPGVEIVDLVDKGRDTYRGFFHGMDTVVHCGFVRAEDENRPDQRFWAEFANVQMAYNVYQTAWEEKVRRAVIASSNHAADYYEPLILRHEMDYLTPEMRAFSDNYYGWAKEVYEHLGFVFAVGKVNAALAHDMQTRFQQRSSGPTVPARESGRPLENVQLRIGAPRETDIGKCTQGDLTCVRRALAAYISQRDMAQLFIKSIETEDIRDENGVPFQVFYGVSNNSHAFWSITNARRVIGYEPEDNSELRFHDLVAEHIAAAQTGKGT